METTALGNTSQRSNLLILKIFEQAVLYFKLCLLFLVPLDNTVESGSIFLTAPHQEWIHIDRILSAALFNPSDML